MQPIWNSHFWDYYLFSSLPLFRQRVDQRYIWCGVSKSIYSSWTHISV